MNSDDTIKELRKIKKLYEQSKDYVRLRALDYAICILEQAKNSKCMHKSGDKCRILTSCDCTTCQFKISYDEYVAQQRAIERLKEEKGIITCTEKVDGVSRKRAKRKK